MNLVKVIFFLLLLSLTFSSCDKDEVELPRGTMEATIDGDAFTVSDATATLTSTNATLLRLEGTQSSTATSPTRRITLALLTLNGNLIEVGSYNQTGNCTGANAQREVCIVGGFSFLANGGQLDYDTEDTDNPGTVTIDISSIDFRVGGHVSGTFSQRLINDGGETIEISEGAFNLDITE